MGSAPDIGHFIFSISISIFTVCLITRKVGIHKNPQRGIPFKGISFMENIKCQGLILSLITQIRKWECCHDWTTREGEKRTSS